MVVEMVPLKGGIGDIVHPPGSARTINIPVVFFLPIGGLYATYHLLGEPETTIDLVKIVVWTSQKH